MNLANFTFQSFRILLLPFALLYGGLIWLRNRLYDKKIFQSASFNLPVICVGNLSVGGTGKSPMIEYLVRLLKDDYKLATLSRGYKRKTKGYALAGDQTSALEIGDEPMQFHLKFPDIAVAVGEERIEAIPQLLQDVPGTEVILLDDAFQHRAIRPGFSVVLTDIGNLFTRDFFLPTGDLRDEKSSYKRADIIVVTKCKPDLSEEERMRILKEINPLAHQRVFFSTIVYGVPYHILRNEEPYFLHKNLEVLLLTGIANIEPLKKFVLDQTYTYERISYSDHHVFTIDDLKEIKRRFDKLDHTQKIILTTEKDAVRLIKFREELEGLPLYVLPIQHEILFGEEPQFRTQFTTFIEQFNKTDKTYGK